REPQRVRSASSRPRRNGEERVYARRNVASSSPRRPRSEKSRAERAERDDTMKKHVPDNEIRAEVRSLLVRQRVDQWRMQVRVANGMVRVTGELIFLRGSDPTPPYLVENLERSLNSAPGVKHATLDVTNWSKLSGEWKVTSVVGASALASAA